MALNLNLLPDKPVKTKLDLKLLPDKPEPTPKWEELRIWAREQEALPWPVRPEEERRLVKPEITPEVLPPLPYAPPIPVDIEEPRMRPAPPALPEELKLRAYQTRAQLAGMIGTGLGLMQDFGVATAEVFRIPLSVFSGGAITPEKVIPKYQESIKDIKITKQKSFKVITQATGGILAFMPVFMVAKGAAMGVLNKIPAFAKALPITKGLITATSGGYISGHLLKPRASLKEKHKEGLRLATWMAGFELGGNVINKLLIKAAIAKATKIHYRDLKQELFRIFKSRKLPDAKMMADEMAKMAKYEPEQFIKAMEGKYFDTPAEHRYFMERLPNALRKIGAKVFPKEKGIVELPFAEPSKITHAERGRINRIVKTTKLTNEVKATKIAEALSRRLGVARLSPEAAMKIKKGYTAVASPSKEFIALRDEIYKRIIPDIDITKTYNIGTTKTVIEKSGKELIQMLKMNEPVLSIQIGNTDLLAGAIYSFAVEPVPEPPEAPIPTPTEAEAISRIKVDVARIKPVEPIKEEVEPPFEVGEPYLKPPIETIERLEGPIMARIIKKLTDAGIGTLQSNMGGKGTYPSVQRIEYSRNWTYIHPAKLLDEATIKELKDAGFNVIPLKAQIEVGDGDWVLEDIHEVNFAAPLGTPKQVDKINERKLSEMADILIKAEPLKEVVKPVIKPIEEIKPEVKPIEEAKPIAKELEPLAVEARKYKTAVEFMRATWKKQKALVADLMSKSKEAFANSQEIAGTARAVRQNERYIELGIELKNRAIREERKLLNVLSADKLQDIYAQAIKEKPIKPPVEKKVVKPPEKVVPKIPIYQKEVEKVYQDTIKILEETLDKSEVKRMTKELAGVKLLMRSAFKGDKEIRQIRQRIMAWVMYKGLTKKATQDVIKEVSGHLSLTHRDITFDQYSEILSKVQVMRPDKIGFKTVITKKTEDRIQILKDNLINREELLIEDYRGILEKIKVKYPAYISRHRFTTESKGREIINNILDYVPITKQKVKISKAMDRNPIIKRDYERTKRLNKVKYGLRLAKVSSLLDIHHYGDSLEKQTGEPIGQLTERLISKKKELDIVVDKKIAIVEKAGGDKFKEIAENEKADNRIHRYIASKMPEYVDERPKMPDNITKEEKAVAEAIIKGLKGFEGDVRYRRFHEWRKFGTPIPNAPAGELNRATKILETEGDDALRKWLVGRSWGIRKSGYDIGEFLKHTITLHKVKPSLSKKHLKTKEATIYREYERDIIRRYASYVRQMTMGTELRSEISALKRIVEDNVNRFGNPREVIMSYESFMKEILGQKDPLSVIEKYVIRTWQQASRAIFLDVRKGVRNLHQNLAFYTGKLDLLRIPKIAKEDKEFFDTEVSNKRGIKRDWLYQDFHADLKLHPIIEYPLRLLDPLNRAADKINVMGFTDEINRTISFSGKLRAIKKLMKKMPEFEKNKESLLKFQRKVGWGDMTSSEGQHALEILATQGKHKMGQYIAKSKTVKIHFLYNRFERGAAEMAGEFRRMLSNLLTFRKGTIQRVALDMNKIISPVERRIATGKGVPRRATHSIIVMVVSAAFTGWLYQKLTGDKRNPYRIDNIVGDMSLGGLAMGVQEHIGDFTTGVMASLAGDKAALNRTISNIARSGDMFIPFYDEVINAIEGAAGYVNIDKAVLRQLKVALLKRHKTKPMGFYRTERTLLEAGQHIIFGTQRTKEKPKKKRRRR